MAGSQALYSCGGAEVLVNIMAVHSDEAEPYYTVVVDGRERQTDGSHLRPAPVAVTNGSHHGQSTQLAANIVQGTPVKIIMCHACRQSFGVPEGCLLVACAHCGVHNRVV